MEKRKKSATLLVTDFFLSSVVTLEYHQLRFTKALYNFIKCTIFSQVVISREKCTKNVTRKIKLVQNCKN